MRTLVPAVLAIASIAVAGPAAAAVGKPPRLPTHRLAVMAWRKARSLGDPSVRHALVYETTHRTAADVLFHDRDPRRDRRRSEGPWVFVIILRGRFTCQFCTGPPGHKPPRGRLADSVWSPYRGEMDWGLDEAPPRFLARLGRPVRVELRAP